MRRFALALLAAASSWLAGCDQLGMESASQVAARREAEGKAVGGACRQAARSIEACYDQNKRADKAAVFAGWREMNDYMRENKLDAMPAPELAADTTPAADKGDGSETPERPERPEASGKGGKGGKGEKAEKAEKTGKADASPDGGSDGDDGGKRARPAAKLAAAKAAGTGH